MQRQHHKIDQNTDEWFELRLGRFTASTFGDLFMDKKTAGYQKAIYKPVYERLTGEMPETFTSSYMERGHEIEGLAAEWYEMDTFQEVKKAGFWTIDKWIGASPDRLVDGNGLLEIKAPAYNTMMDILIGEHPIEKRYFWQCYGQIATTGREWCDLLYFHPKLEPVKIRFNRDDENEDGEKYVDLLGMEVFESIEKAKVIYDQLKRKAA